MKVLLSIRPEYANKIFSGEKRYEYRKNIFKKKNIDSILVYSTKPVGKIIGEIYIDEIIEDEPNNIWVNTHEFSGITHNYFQDYFNDRELGFAIKIKEAILFDRPLELADVISSGKAPQSFCYI
ncbi:ASCH domain-containing protein [Cohnella endophytica]|uniref:ASCH domain-containing protein n=1 Tax=Cohnella endophytica TaxID=2419778 RepID=A0A494XIF1_9BACL|nr:ASCH domain-containing protein [Cohnella endophytica]RKP47854.1 ASCH domain-containing protein [Cohnella endophytica]